MNWFQRYGIPGAYFVGFTVLLGYALFSNKMPSIQTEGFWLIPAIATIIFLPIGYILYVFQLILYLTIPKLGLHRQALNRVNFDLSKYGFPKSKKDTYSESTLEPYIYALVVYKFSTYGNHKISTDGNQRFLKEEDFVWINKRMDVLAINFSFFAATIISIWFVLLFRFFFPFCLNPIFIMLAAIITIFVFIVMSVNYRLLREQIILAIIELYIKFGGELKKNKKEKK